MKQGRPLERDKQYKMNIAYCQNFKNSSFLIHLDICIKQMMRRFGIQKVKSCKT